MVENNLFRIGQTNSFKKTLTQSDITLFLGICGDFHPTHINHEALNQLGFQQPIIPEAILVGMINAVLKNKLPGRNFSLLQQQVEYLVPVFTGDTIEAKVEIINWLPEKRIMTLRLACYNQENKEVITGEAVMISQVN